VKMAHFEFPTPRIIVAASFGAAIAITPTIAVFACRPPG
jgi:preprotein translocase subunit Sec61beta